MGDTFRGERTSRAAGLVRAALLTSLVLLAGCANKPLDLPSGAAADAIFPSALSLPPPRDYKIGPSDTISVSVFNEPEFSANSLRVDVAGNVNIPLIGRVHAAGLSSDMLGRQIGEQLRSGGYLVEPRVTVNLIEAVSQRVTVDGEVNSPGVVALTGPTSLLDAIAMSHGTTRIARLNEVAIFRIVDGQQMAAKFDLRAIRRGEAPNPMLQGNDVVVVGFDKLGAAYRDFLQAIPAFTLFTRIY